MSILRINIVFFGPNIAASQLSKNTKRLISLEREGSEAQILLQKGLYWEYICFNMEQTLIREDSLEM